MSVGRLLNLHRWVKWRRGDYLRAKFFFICIETEHRTLFPVAFIPETSAKQLHAQEPMLLNNDLAQKYERPHPHSSLCPTNSAKISNSRGTLSCVSSTRYAEQKDYKCCIAIVVNLQSSQGRNVGASRTTSICQSSFCSSGQISRAVSCICGANHSVTRTFSWVPYHLT